MRLPFAAFSLTLFLLGSASSAADKLTLDELFPMDRVIDVRITVAEEDWDTIRFQSRNISSALAAGRRDGPLDGPYTWVEAAAVIDGVEFKKVGLRKKGFIGSQSSIRPSLKIKLNHFKKKVDVGGLSTLTFNNNRQDHTMMSQFMGYALFNRAGSTAPRCSFAKITVNGVNLGVYAHVETPREPLLKRGFGNDKGTLYEGTVTDFFPGWERSFENKVGPTKRGRKRVERLIAALQGKDGDALIDSTSRGRAWAPDSGELNDSWSAPEFDDSQWIDGVNGAGYETQSGFESAISDEFNLLGQMYRKNASVYLRFPFDVDDPASLAQGRLLLQMKYDDGFVAYLNGHRVAAANAPDEVTWESRATGSPDDRSAMQFAPFDVTPHRDKLRSGRNVLAIHGLNISPESTDMLIVARLETNDYDYEQEVGKLVDLDAFYQFWAIEGLLGFWDGYSGNRNNYFCYHNPESDRFYFMPWGADCMFEKTSRLGNPPGHPVSVKTNGRIAHKLYQLESGRQRYLATLRTLLEEHWNEEELLAEVDRVVAMIRPHFSDAQDLKYSSEPIREFIANRRTDIEAEIADGMPLWTATLGEPPAITGGRDLRRERAANATNTIWNVARQGDVDAIQDHLNKGVDVNAKDRSGATPLAAAAVGGHLEAIKFLISQGGDVKAKRYDGGTALHSACYYGRLEVVDLLVVSGADVNGRNNRRETPLNVAQGEWRYAQDRLEALADNLHIEINLRQAKTNRERIAEYLRAAGGKTSRELSGEAEDDDDQPSRRSDPNRDESKKKPAEKQPEKKQPEKKQPAEKQPEEKQPEKKPASAEKK
ncbi:MAG: CotH kinase family protein [Pirellulaceae bacterium]|nr:CotH kinase family protein [Pirellulaceae bacterium]